MSSRLSETQFIDWLKQSPVKLPRGAVGIGDDAAVLPFSKKHSLLLAVDSCVDGVDFHLQKVKPSEIGHKVLAQNLSDIAAMGGEAQYALVSLGLTSQTGDVFLKSFYQGMRKLAKRYDVKIIGGDLSRSRNFFASVTVTGICPAGKALLRRGAGLGDAIFVSGELGGSILGRHLSFEPRLLLAKALRKRFSPTSMMDLSDGLAKDMPLLLKASGVGAKIWLDHIPVSPSAFKLAKGEAGRALSHAFCDGEDFELLFTVKARDTTRLERLGVLAGVRLHRIGTIDSSKRVRYYDDSREEQEIKGKWKGFEHF